MAEQSSSLAEQYGPIDGPDPIQQARRSFDRARYLTQQLREYPEQLGRGGHLFLNWLGEISATFDPAPSVTGSHAHLLFDLYERESGLVQKLLDQRISTIDDGEISWSDLLDAAVEREISTALNIVQTDEEGCRPTLPLLELQGMLKQHTFAERSFRDSAEFFVAARKAVYQALSSMDSAAYSKPLPGRTGQTLTDLVQTTVEESGRHLTPIFEAASTPP